MTDKFSKAERLYIAGAIAPTLRKDSERARLRRVCLVNKAGEVVGYTTVCDVQQSLLKKKQIEIEVQDGKRPKQFICRGCGKLRRNVEKKAGRPRTQCDPCRRKKRADRCAAARHAAGKSDERPLKQCTTPGCDNACTHRASRCRACGDAVRAVKRSEAASRAQATRTPEQRSDAARRAVQTRKRRLEEGAPNGDPAPTHEETRPLAKHKPPA